MPETTKQSGRAGDQGGRQVRKRRWGRRCRPEASVSSVTKEAGW